MNSYDSVTPLSRTRILLADDNESIVQTVTSLLEPTYEVVGAVGDGEALINAAASLQPDVLIVDISMPGLTGIEAANILKESGNAAKIVFLTVHTDSDYVRAALATGAFGYVIKSRMVTDLARAIHEALAGRVFVSLLPIDINEN